MAFKKENKYLVLKQEDIKKYLPEDEQKKISFLANVISMGREEDGKKENSYVVVNEDEPYTDIVWGLIRLQEVSAAAASILLPQIRGIIPK